MTRFPGPEFWRNLLSPDGKDRPRRELTAECWDKMADSYDDLENEPDYTRQVERVVNKMDQKGLLRREHTLVDIACGTGTYDLLFAQHLKEVTGIDISGGMLKKFREKAKARGIDNCMIIQANWLDHDLHQDFDIVFSSMNPLLGYYQNIDRMISLSRRYLVLVGWAGIRKNTFLERMAKKIFGRPPRTPRSDITVVFGYLYSLGYSPDIEYFQGTWRRTYPLERQMERVVSRLEFERELTEEERSLVRKGLEELAGEDNTVTLETRVRTGMIVLDKKV